MNTRTGFIALVLGIVLIPLMTASLIMPLLLDQLRPGFNAETFLTAEGIEALMKEETTKKHPRDHVEEPLYTIISGEEIVKSNIEGLPEGAYADRELIGDFLLEASSSDTVQLIRHFPGTSDLAIVSFPFSADAMRSTGRKAIRIVPLSMVLCTILVTTIISLLILRSMNRKFHKLEKAATEISAGNLDYEVGIPGGDYFTSFADTFNQMRIALKEDKERENRFIMGISHDLKTPLTLIGGYAEALTDDMDQSPEEKEKYYTIIRRKLNELESKINTLIDYRQLSTGEWKNVLAETALGTYLEESCQLISEDAEMLNLKFSSEVNIPGDYMVRMDENLFSRTIENIISNSFRYTPEGGSLNLSAYMRQGKAVVEICDTGKGISAADLERVTEPFYRGTKSRREQGFGLGLAIVKTIVDTHGWDLKIESDGRGTGITISGI